MTPRLMHVGRKLQARMRDFFDASPDASAPPLELLQAALDQLERKVQPSGRGVRSFPYSRIAIHIAQPEGDRAAIEAVFAQLPARLRERLTEMRCEPPADLEAPVIFEESAPDGGAVLWIECTADATATPTPALPESASPEPPELHLSVITGRCEQPAYTFQNDVIAIGRGIAPADTRGRVRHNHIAFLEVRDGASETVARAHARLEFDATLQAYVLFNESSSNPTFIRRAGRTLPIAFRDPRGVRVQPGDELQLGRAVLKISTQASESK